MKKLYTLAALALFSASAVAQNYITPAPEGGFDFDGAKDMVILYVPGNLIQQLGMAGKIAPNGSNNLDQSQTNNYLEYWVTDWDSKALTLYNVPEEGVTNSFGGTDYLNATPLYEWGTGTFMAKARPYNLSSVTDKHHIHIGLRDFGKVAAMYKFSLGPNKDIKTNGFQFMVGDEVGAAYEDFVAIGSLPNGNDGKWYYIDLPISDLIDPDGNFGFTYDFSQPIEKQAAFSFSFAKPNGVGDDYKFCTVAEHKDNGGDVYDYTVTELGAALSIDHVFLYVPVPAGIDNVAVDAEAEVLGYYDLQGRKVGNPEDGVFVKVTTKGAKKVIL